MPYGLQVSKPGLSLGSNNILELALTTDYPILKAINETEDTVTFASGDTEKSYILVSNYSYYNEIWCFVDYEPGGSIRGRVGCGLVRGSTGIQNDGTNIKLILTDFGTGSERIYGIHFYIFGDSAV